MAKKSGLRRGLDTIFNENAMEVQAQGTVTNLRVSMVEPRPDQPRQNFDKEALAQLADSIAANGVLQPILVRPSTQEGFYQIIAGERRWRAARMAGISEIPARIVDVDDREAMALALVENLQREDLNPVEQARGLRRLLEEYGCTQESAAELVGCSRPALTNALRLLALPEPVLAMLEDGRLSAGHGRTLLALGDEKRIQSAAEEVLRQQLSVRQTEAMVRKLLSPPKKAETKKDDAIYVKALEERLTRSFNRKVHIVSGPRKGRLEIEYYGNEDLDALIAALGLPAGDGEANDNA